MRTAMGIFLAAAVGLMVWGLVDLHRWSNRCHDAGGMIETRFEGYITTYSYTYDAKGNVTGMTPQMTPDYSYHCWVNGSEVNV
jgi:hypothetical protein